MTHMDFRRLDAVQDGELALISIEDKLFAIQSVTLLQDGRYLLRIHVIGGDKMHLFVSGSREVVVVDTNTHSLFMATQTAAPDDADPR